jgi:cystathionine gamma-synthase
MSNKEGFLYARDDTPTRKRLEAIIGKIEHGVAVTYGSGLAAIYAALTFLRPKV